MISVQEQYRSDYESSKARLEQLADDHRAAVAKVGEARIALDDNQDIDKAADLDKAHEEAISAALAIQQELMAENLKYIELEKLVTV